MRLDKEILTAKGKLASEDVKTFSEIVSALVDSWNITKPPDLMIANRMVSTWMKMRRVEDLMSKYDLFFEQTDSHGNLVGININQLAYYLKSLESDFRSYYKVLQSNCGKATDDAVQDFHDFLNAKPVKKKKK